MPVQKKSGNLLKAPRNMVDITLNSNWVEPQVVQLWSVKKPFIECVDKSLE